MSGELITTSGQTRRIFKKRWWR